MNRNDRFIRQLESYLDHYEGVTSLPESVRAAVRAELPKTKQARPLGGPARYLMMTLRTAPIVVAAAAAVLVLAVGALLLTGRNVGDTNGPTPSSMNSVDPSAQGCERSRARAQAPGEIDVRWCAYGLGDPRTLAFTMEGPAAWADQVFTGDGTLWLRPAGGGAITFALRPDQSVEELVEELSATPEYAVSNIGSVTLGGAVGQVLDLALAEGVSSGDAAPLIEDPDQTWRLQEGAFTRVWAVDVAGDTVMIVTGESLAQAVGDALATIDWES